MALTNAQKQRNKRQREELKKIRLESVNFQAEILHDAIGLAMNYEGLEWEKYRGMDAQDTMRLLADKILADVAEAQTKMAAEQAAKRVAEQAAEKADKPKRKRKPKTVPTPKADK